MRHWQSLIAFSSVAAGAAINKRQEAALVYPDHELLSDCPGYAASGISITDNGIKADLKLAGEPCNVYGEDLEELILEATYESDNRLHVKIQDKGNSVWQVPESVFPRPGGTSSADSNALKFDFVEEPFSFSVSRKDTGEVIFDTSAAALVFESQYLRLRTSLPQDPYLYGLGEHSDPFRLKTTDYIRTLWNQDSWAIPAGANLYGSQPFYLEHRESGSHGVLFLNSNGMDILIDNDNDGQFLEYNTLGGVLDFWFLAGPSPIEVTKQYAEVVGLPAFQSYWSLGFHQCRYGYRDAFNVAEVVYNYSKAEIPLETMWTDIDYMDRRLVFTTDPERYPLEKLRSLVTYLHEHDQHYIVMVDPAAGYQDGYAPVQRGLEQDVFLKRDNGSEWLGVVWPGVSVFPDWFAENTQSWWNNEFALFFNPEDGVDIDGLWIDMNEPSNFPCFFPCDNPYAAAKGYPPPAPPVRENPRPLPGFPCEFQPPRQGGCDVTPVQRDLALGGHSPPITRREESFDQLEVVERRQSSGGDQSGLPGRDLLYPKYAIHNKAAYRESWNADKGGISNKTVNTNVIHQNGYAMYDTHQIYGAMMGAASHEALVQRRPGKRPLIITRSTFPGSGAKVGRWLGDNLSNWNLYRASIRTMLAYTSIFQFPMTGSDVCGFGENTTEELCARWVALGAFQPFFRNHNHEKSASQEFYLWASVAESARNAIRIRYRLLDYLYTAMHGAHADGTPPLYPLFYLYPEDKATWALELQYFYGPGLLVAPVTQQGATSVSVYLPQDTFFDWYTHEPVCGTGAAHTFTGVGITEIPLLIRGGVIMPTRINSAYTTTELRTRDFELLIPLDSNYEAKGELYVDDGESIDPEANGGVTRIDFTFKNGWLSIDGDFGYELDVSLVKLTFLGAFGCDSSQYSPDEYSISIDVDISLNEAGEHEIEGAPGPGESTTNF